MVRIKLQDGPDIEWNGTVSFVEDSRIFLLIKSGEHGAKIPAAAYPAENVVAVEGDSGSFDRKQGQPQIIEIRGDSILEPADDE